jgi:hypothetical protein
VVPTVVDRMIAAQYGNGWKRSARTWIATAARNSTRKISVPAA